MVCYGCKQSLPFKTLIPASVALSKEVYYPFLRSLFRALTSQKRHFLSTMEDTAVGSFFLMENSPMVYFQLLPLSPCTTLGWSLISARSLFLPQTLAGLLVWTARCGLSSRRNIPEAVDPPPHTGGLSPGPQLPRASVTPAVKGAVFLSGCVRFAEKTEFQNLGLLQPFIYLLSET